MIAQSNLILENTQDKGVINNSFTNDSENLANQPTNIECIVYYN